MNGFKPTVFWLTGLSGAGKTTLGTQLTNQLRARGEPVIFLDGDVLRSLFNDTTKHDQQSRLDIGMKYARLCQMLVAQGVHVVCATISLFHQIQDWNRNNIKNYIEIFLDVPMDELIKRDSKQIYSRAHAGEICNIMGIDIAPELPKQADVVIHHANDMNHKDSIELILRHYNEHFLGEKTCN